MFKSFSSRSLTISNYFGLSKEEQNELVEKAVKRLRYMFEELDEDDIRKMLREKTIVTALIFPRCDVRSKSYEVAVDYLARLFQADDFMDTEECSSFDDVAFVTRTMLKKPVHWRQAFEPNTDQEFKEFEHMCPPGAEVTMRLFSEIPKSVENEMPEFAEKMKHTLIATYLSAQAHPFIIRKEDPLNFSEEGMKTIREFENGVGGLAEFGALLNGATISKKIRKSLLFSMVSSGVRTYGGLINDLLGLQKDIKKDATNENCILRRIVREGASLETSFAEAVKRLQNTIHDINVAMVRLLEAFPDEPGLANFFQAFKDFCDGQILSYVVASQLKGRYGAMSMEIVTVI